MPKDMKGSATDDNWTQARQQAAVTDLPLSPSVIAGEYAFDK